MHRSGMEKMKNALGMLYDKRIRVGLNDEAYHMIVKPTLLHGQEC